MTNVIRLQGSHEYYQTRITPIDQQQLLSNKRGSTVQRDTKNPRRVTFSDGRERSFAYKLYSTCRFIVQCDVVFTSSYCLVTCFRACESINNKSYTNSQLVFCTRERMLNLSKEDGTGQNREGLSCVNSISDQLYPRSTIVCCNCVLEFYWFIESRHKDKLP